MDKRQRILQATGEMIVEYGLQACPMSKISSRANCGAGTIYRYFDTKEELVRALFVDQAERMTEICLSAYDAEQPLRGRFEVLWGSFYQHMVTNPGERALLEQLMVSPLIDHELKDEVLNKLHQATHQLLDDGKREGVFKDMPNEVMTTMTFGSLIQMAKHLAIHPEKFTSEVIPETVLNMCWDAIRR